MPQDSIWETRQVVRAGGGRRTPLLCLGEMGMWPPGSHQPQEVEEEVCVLADQVVGLAAQVDKVMEAAGGLVPPVDDIRHVRSEDERRPVPAPVREGQKVTMAGGHPPPRPGEGASPVK